MQFDSLTTKYMYKNIDDSIIPMRNSEVAQRIRRIFNMLQGLKTTEPDNALIDKLMSVCKILNIQKNELLKPENAHLEKAKIAKKFFAIQITLDFLQLYLELHKALNDENAAYNYDFKKASFAFCYIMLCKTLHLDQLTMSDPSTPNTPLYVKQAQASEEDLDYFTDQINNLIEDIKQIAQEQKEIEENMDLGEQRIVQSGRLHKDQQIPKKLKLDPTDSKLVTFADKFPGSKLTTEIMLEEPKYKTPNNSLTYPTKKKSKNRKQPS